MLFRRPAFHYVPSRAFLKEEFDIPNASLLTAESRRLTANPPTAESHVNVSASLSRA